ncbi:MAG TPA: PilZ domain-containing protein [Polyangiaceae bacterium]|nr:PilZ domain-containing protein [Polyangiaceae bacterium]
MIERQERRAPGVNRIPVARLVDICGRDASVPAFEAESIELSGRGMHVRTPYLPPLGAPLVCRLEDNGREIVVEGTVAWQRNSDGGGEFGVQFTALDSGSVAALKSLCGLDDEPSEAKQEEPEPELSVEPAPAGAAVKLHIDGLGAPMKARVRKGGSRRLQVGSNLEFLKVGRGLQVEDVEQGQRRGAKIDAVSIAIDPQTQVPQLVVALRYEGEDTTPEPSVIGDELADVAAKAAPERDAVRPAGKPASSEADDDGEDEDDDAAAMRGPVDAFAVSIGKAAQATGEKLAEASGSAAALLARIAKASGARIGEVASRRAATPKRRSTSPAPQVPVPNPQRRLRPQNGERENPTATKSRRRKVIAGAVVSVLGLAVAATTMNRHPAKGASSDAVAARDLGAIPATPSQAPLPGAQLGAPGVSTPLPGAPLAQGATNATAPTPGQPGVAPGAATPRPGVVANVPLFGPTTMATLEPAPLGPSPDEIGASTVSPAPRATEERMDDDEPRSGAHDEVFDDGASSKKSDADKSDPDKAAEEKAEAVKPFVTGKLHLPIVYRMKLDHPGIGLVGKKEMGGFSIDLPGRRVLDGGAGIPKRDDRIAEVRTKNGPTGAHVTFVFRSKIPTYKVRLRKNYVEFFISSPDNVK